MRGGRLVLGAVCVAALACSEGDGGGRPAEATTAPAVEEPAVVPGDVTSGRPPAISAPPLAAPTEAIAPTTAPASPVARTTLAPAPLALSEVTGAGHDGRLWTAGGLTADGAGSTAVQVYDPAVDAWTAGPDLPVAVHHAAMVSLGDRLLLLGGYEGSDFSMPTKAVWVLEDPGEAWVPGPSLPEPRAAGAAAFDGTDLVFGGGVGPIGVAAEVWRLEGEGWGRVGVLSTPREHLSAAGADGVVWFMGGRVAGLDTNLGRVDVVIDGEVRPLGDVLPPAGGVSGFATPDGRGCMVGGEDPAVALATVACVDVRGASSALPDLAMPRHGLAVGVAGDQAYIAMGGPRPGLFVSDVIEALPLGG